MSNFPPPPPPGGGFPSPEPPPGGGFAPPTPGFSGYAPTTGGELAGFGARLGAWILDRLITAVFFVPGLLVLITGPKETQGCPDSISTDPFAVCTGPTDATRGAAYLLYGLAFIGSIFYYAILDGRGATIGKRTVGLRVIDMNTGQPIGTGRGVGRFFGQIVSSLLCYLGFFWMLWDDRKQTWHDKMVRSVVVRAD